MSAHRSFAVLLVAAGLLLAAGCEAAEQPRFEVRMPFAVKYATPAAGYVGTRDVAEHLSVFAAFSAPIHPASLEGVALLRNGAPVGEGARPGPRPHELALPHGALEVGDYEFVLPAGLRSVEGDELGIELRIPFRIEPSPGPAAP